MSRKIKFYLFVFVFHLFFLVVSSTSAFSATNCPDGVSGSGDPYPYLSASYNSSTGSTLCETFSDSQLQLAIHIGISPTHLNLTNEKFRLVVFGNIVIAYFYSVDTNQRTAISSATCVGATVSENSALSIVQFTLPLNHTCQVKIKAQAGSGGSQITYTAILKNTGGLVTAENGVISGDVFDNNILATVQTNTKNIIANFMSRRADQITANDPELVTRLQNRGSEGETGQFTGFTAEGTLTNNKLAFSTSLRQMIIAKEQEKSELRKGLGDMMSLGTQSLTQNIDPNGWDLWVKGTWSQSESDTATNDLGLLYLGVDYRVSPTLLVGFLTQFDWSDETDNVDNISVEGKGWMAGPYVITRLHKNLLFDGRAAWGQSENDVSPFGTYRDQFDTTRWLLRGQFTGDFKAGNLNLAPHVGVLYFEEEQDAYTDSLNVYIPGQTISLGRLTFGPKISTTIQTSDGTIIYPHLSLKGIWDFDKAEIVDLDTGIATGSSEDLRARVEGGLSVQMSNGWSLNGEGFYDGIGVNDLEAYGGSLKLSVPLN